MGSICAQAKVLLLAIPVGFASAGCAMFLGPDLEVPAPLSTKHRRYELVVQQLRFDGGQQRYRISFDGEPARQSFEFWGEDRESGFRFEKLSPEQPPPNEAPFRYEMRRGQKPAWVYHGVRYRNEVRGDPPAHAIQEGGRRIGELIPASSALFVFELPAGRIAVGIDLLKQQYIVYREKDAVAYAALDWGYWGFGERGFHWLVSEGMPAAEWESVVFAFLVAKELTETSQSPEAKLPHGPTPEQSEARRRKSR